MKSFLLFALYGMFATPSFGQVSLDWLKTVAAPSETAGSIVTDKTNNSYAAAVGGNTTYITKRDRNGATVWSVSASSSSLEGIVELFLDPQGNPVVTGFQYYNTINGKVVTSLLVRKFTAAGDSVYRKIIPGLFTYLDGGDIEHPGNNRSKVSAAMDKTGTIYFGTGGMVGGFGIGFNIIKVGANGNLVRVSTNNFNLDTSGSVNPYYIVGNIAVQGNRVGVTGSTKKVSTNVSTWVTDTAGNNIWSRSDKGLGGNDITFDDAGNSYVVSSALNGLHGTYTDILLYKFNPRGKVLLSKSLDFGGDETAGILEFTPDKNLVIAGHGVFTSTLGFSDWLTIKTDTNGNVLWSKTYNKSNYDELPRAIAIDAASNLYVTGSAGPDTGDFLYGLNGVTIKYSASGTQLWVSQIQLEHFTPIDIALGKDTTVFVLSAPAASVAHLIQKSKAAGCGVPQNLQADSITQKSALLSWKKVPDVFLYDLQYKTAASDTWVPVTTTANTYRLENLLQGTTYEFRVQTVCAVGPSGFSPVKSFTTGGNGYCASKGPDNNFEWIDYVELNTLRSDSGPDDGYADYTAKSTTLVQGNTYTLYTSAYRLNGNYEAWRIWIDYNQDGDFDDAGELLTQFTNNYINLDEHNIKVPSNALPGSTRMRVSMKAGTGYSTPCETLTEGEVEDYTIVISTPAFVSTITQQKLTSTLQHAIVFPSPANDLLMINLQGFDGEVQLQVCDMAGKILLNKKTAPATQATLQVENFSKGVYLLRMIDKNGNTRSIKWIKN